MRKKRSIIEKPALDLLEEAVALLRSSPGTLALYYVGTAPFVLGFLFFWTDMSRGAFAREHLVESSLLLAVEFLWCKFWQSIFSVNLLAAACRRTLPPWTWRRLLRVAVAQAAIQPSGLFILPVAALITIPFGHAYAFYQNVTALALDGNGEVLESAPLRREALAQARRWPAQNYFGLGILSCFQLAVFLNLLIIILALPWLLKSLLGVETMFSRSLWSMFNTTLFCATAGLSYLCADPIFKAFYVLRCFRGRSLATGEDLQVALHSSRGTFVPAIAAAVLLTCATLAQGSTADTPPNLPARSAAIDQSISQVLARPEFAWRSPRDETAANDQESTFLRGAFSMIGRWLRPIKGWVRDFFDWLGRQINHHDESEPTGGGADWGAVLRIFAWVFCGIAVCALAVIGWKLWVRRDKAFHVVATPQMIPPDLTADDVAADQLPEDAWISLAREMVERGDLRLALRALYLAALAHLGKRQLISIARHKSNREYQRELRRRRPAEENLNATFEDTVTTFERAWYGMHDVTGDNLNASQVNLEKIRQS